MIDGEQHRLTEDELNRESYRINAVNPSQIELRLALEPGGPESLDEAVWRVLSGEPLIQPAGGGRAPLWAEDSAQFMEPPGGEAPPNLPEPEAD